MTSSTRLKSAIALKTRRTAVLTLSTALFFVGCDGFNRAFCAADAPWSDVSAPNALASEERFFDLLWRLDSPILVERNAAEDELTRRFVEFESVWQNREFLTSGEISAEAAWRFEIAEARNRLAVERQVLDAFRTTLDVGSVSDEPNAPGLNGVREGGARPCRLRIAWRAPIRVVYLAPDLRSFFWRDPNDGSVWRPRERFSTPEISPEFDATSLEIVATLERVDDAETLAALETPENGANAGIEAGAFEILLGADLRDFNVPINDANATPNADLSAPKTFRSGALTLGPVSTRRKENGETTVFLRFDFDQAFDAFDSHRVWFDQNDFSTAIRSDSKSAPQIFTPLRLRTRSRSARGVSVELDFPATATDAFEAAAATGGSAVLRSRLPRFFLFARLPFRAGTENSSAVAPRQRRKVSVNTSKTTT